MIKVVNYKNFQYDKRNPQHIYIGRANKRYGLKKSPLANPYKISKRDSREHVLSFYRDWLYEKALAMKGNEVQEEMVNIQKRQDKYGLIYLVCWCKPLSCHGDIIKELFEYIEFS